MYRHTFRGSVLPVTLYMLLASATVAASGYSEPRVPCRDYNPQNNLYWGDLHVHTRYSLDAATQTTRTTPAQAYDFARGAKLGIQPWRHGLPLRTLQLERPLDFAAVTDHAELLGEVVICADETLEGYDSLYCRAWRWSPRAAFFLFNMAAASGKHPGFCGENGERCRAAAAGPWQEMQTAAEAAYDRSPECSFTSFVAYEWTGASGGLQNVANIHRNVIFRNAEVPALPTSFIDSRRQVSLLYRQLDEACLDAEGACDVLVIPHNSNLSSGYMFLNRHEDGEPLTAADADTRRRLETLVELLQHKGSSECFFEAGMSKDELCAFEQLPYDKFSGKFISWLAEEPEAGDGFVREVLRDGLAHRAELGSNPFQFGFIGSTDTHLGAAGAVSERGYPGHGGAGEPAGGDIPSGLVDDLEYNPGGLAAVWAPENSRDALFEAMRRRETYASSGPRMTLRVFAGDNLPDTMCDTPDFIAQGYLGGVPMGAEIHGAGRAQLAVAATRDPTSQPLQRVQIVKGWIDDAGLGRETVVDIAGDARNGASVDLATCLPRGEGFNTLCAVWEDPAFSPTQHAYYYARVLENPSCRWSQYICAANGVDCGQPSSITAGLEQCCTDEHRPLIQERAVSSPVWFVPGNDATTETL